LLSEVIARSEAVGPGILPCDDPSHPHGAPPSAVCGMMLDRSFHMSTFTLGGLASELLARLWHMFQELTWGYEPAGSRAKRWALCHERGRFEDIRRPA